MFPILATRGRLATWLPCLALCTASLLGSAALSLTPSASGPVAALFPPWWTATRSLLAASTAGRPVRFGLAPFLVVIVPDGQGATRRLHRAGAWLLLDPGRLGGCVAAALFQGDAA